jgi:hypothetical protein
MAHKELKFDEDARRSLKRGIDRLADVVGLAHKPAGTLFRRIDPNVGLAVAGDTAGAGSTEPIEQETTQ